MINELGAQRIRGVLLLWSRRNIVPGFISRRSATGRCDKRCRRKCGNVSIPRDYSLAMKLTGWRERLVRGTVVALLALVVLAAGLIAHGWKDCESVRVGSFAAAVIFVILSPIWILVAATCGWVLSEYQVSFTKLLRIGLVTAIATFLIVYFASPISGSPCLNL